MNKEPTKKVSKLKGTPPIAELNQCYQENKLVESLTTAFKGRSQFSGNGLTLHDDPFTCCSMPKFLEDESFLVELKDELLNLRFFEKNNDLYKFHQSDDLKKAKSPYIVALRKFLYGSFRDWMQNITGLQLESTVDMSCARYDHTDILLCHDDMLEGRRIAYIFYLVPAWKEGDGGSLELFSVDKESGDPCQVVKSIVPQWNSFAFFEVDHRSFHQVSEVLTEDKTRLSISGWFYGEPLNYPAKKEKVNPPMLLPLCLEEDKFSILDWMNEMYVDTDTLTEIRHKFKDDSEVELVEFLDKEAYVRVAAALKDSSIRWNMQGPPNKKMYEVAECDSLPDVIRQCLEFMQSDMTFFTLAHLTGLKLHQMTVMSDSDSDDESEEETDKKNGVGGVGESSCHPGNSSGDEEPEEKRRKTSPTADTENSSNEATSLDGDACSVDDADVDDSSVSRKKEKSSSQRSDDGSVDAKVSFEVRRWSHGSYTLLHDCQQDVLDFALDATLFFNCEGWSNDCGGYISYLSKDEDDELLTVYPRGNALALVFRDKKTLGFVKHVNHRATKLEGSQEFYTISAVYCE